MVEKKATPATPGTTFSSVGNTSSNGNSANTIVLAKRKAIDKLAPDDSVSTKRTKADRIDDTAITLPSRIPDRGDGELLWAGYKYGQYVGDSILLAKVPLDFTTFVDALPAHRTGRFVYNVLGVHKLEEKIKADTEARFAEKSANIKRAVDIMGSVRSDIQCSSPDQAAQLSTILHNMHSCTKASAIFLHEYTHKTKDDLEVVQNAQERLQKYGSEEEIKLQKRVVESVNERLERLQKLETLVG